ncbi:uncharacterized protein LOC115891651 isoform X2 [Sitophilus oryzae]|uniref:Uncharacterized protein LOC115891651 isoform X2 n=1 Tax=Sitophilus oryzae TaxID=7048 RepID=A0A6J2YVA0_SITOR|nr:uncharacterized protein LOC115891651 isoform X2 [Sitophilus oryzae]XP_030768044.1 uncharacterized protein LOC115891651 isoform X2 [Sitophilus oryzae]
MDPWACYQEENVINFDEKITKFEDDFIPENYDRLPDHKEYLEILESKLRKIKTNPSVLQQILAKKDAYMVQLLTDETTSFTESTCLDEPIQNSQLLRTLLPQKQALNQGEVVDLIKFDQLALEVEEAENSSVTNNKLVTNQNNIKNSSL